MLLKKAWLFRAIQEESLQLLITYSGRGLGSESVTINGDHYTQPSMGLWYIPTFDINHEDNHIIVHVRVWPWMALRSIRISVDSKEIYSEGTNPYSVTKTSEFINAISFYGIILSLLFAFIYPFT